MAFLIACDGEVSVSNDGSPQCDGFWVLQDDAILYSNQLLPDLSVPDALILTSAFATLLVTAFVWKKLRKLA